MNILCIGNSFSVDASTYVHQIAEAAGKDLNIYGLYIGGCPIDQHYKQYFLREKIYHFYKNGERTPFMVCDLITGLDYMKWDYITFQQVSHLSGDANTYFPELPQLMELVRKHSDAKFILHKTWSYAKTFSHWKYGEKPLDQDWMDRDIKEAYEIVSEKVGIKPVIPSGTAITKARLVFGDELNRDGFHLNERGRTLCGYVWAYFFLGMDIKPVGFMPSGSSYEDNVPPVDQSELETLSNIAKEALLEERKHGL